MMKDMDASFSDMLAVGGKKNSLGLVGDAIKLVLSDKSRLEELYKNIIEHDDPWVRMRAVDAFEKICRQYPEWIKPYINRIQNDLATSSQPSIQWHIAQIYNEVDLDESQKLKAVEWLKTTLSTANIDWIVSANCMTTLARFTAKGDVTKPDLEAALKTQLNHKSNAVVKKATKFLSEFS